MAKRLFFSPSKSNAAGVKFGKASFDLLTDFLVNLDKRNKDNLPSSTKYCGNFKNKRVIGEYCSVLLFCRKHLSFIRNGNFKKNIARFSAGITWITVFLSVIANWNLSMSQVELVLLLCISLFLFGFFKPSSRCLRFYFYFYFFTFRCGCFVFAVFCRFF